METIVTIYIVMFFFGIYFISLFILLYLKHKKELFFNPEAKNFPKISLITAAFNEQDTIASTIEAVMSLDYPKDKLEHIIVDDGSSDRTSEIVKNLMKKYPSLKLIEKTNSGKANSINLAIKQAKGEIMGVVDADSYPTKSSLKKMIGWFEDKQVAAVTSKVLVKNKKNFIEKFQAVDYIVIAWGRKILDFIGCVYVTNGPLSLYRKNLVIKAGGFDPTNLTEDIEITWHLLSQGYKTKMSYDAEVYTVVPNKFKQWIKQRIRWNMGGLQTIYKYRNFAFKGKNLFGYFVLSYVSLSFFLAFIGFLLFLRYIILKSILYFRLTPYLLQGYNPLDYWNINLSASLLFIMGALFFAISLVYYKFSMQKSEFQGKSIFKILIYIFIYRPLYLIPYLGALYKLTRRDIRWFTK